MKYIAFLIVFGLITVPSAFADYLEDVKNLGYISGEGIACGASRYPSYEMVARAFLVSSARSDEEQAKGMIAYNSAKAQAYSNKRLSGLWDCNETNYRFNNQKIFQTKLYKDGRLKMPDGKIIIPRQKYDVTQVYDRNSNEREELNKRYNQIIAKKRKMAKEQGVYKKIREAELRAANNR